MSNGGSRLMAPMTALRMVDIPSNVATLAPKPMLLNVAKRARMNIRRQKRAITWTDLSCRGRFGSCAKCQYPDGCALRGPSGHGRRHRDAASCDIGSFAVLPEVVGQDRLVKRARGARCRRDAGPARRRGNALGFYERAQDRQRQIRMTGLDRLIEPIGKLALARQRAIPLALVVGDAANLPLRQLQIDQRQRRVVPGAGLY